ncbi:MAG: hypothetical protein IKW20_02815 [Bacteroidales bacterium]|nr:hypothetical protein [Bacteroidales bacterium]MBR5834093.1 hypothetical protein [Bacteroidales bacterium]
MRFFITFTLFVLSLTGCNSIDVADIQEGDIVFIESQSRQSPYIKVGTMSKWTHCGVIVSTSQGLQVLEASKTVRLTPVDKFIGAAKNDNWRIKRPDQQLPKRISYSKYLGMPYDLQFKLDNGKMYCSELVWQVYKDQGIELCEPRKVSSFIMTRIPKVKKLMEQRQIKPEQYAIAPVDIYKAL